MMAARMRKASFVAGNDGKPLSDEPDGPRDAGCRRIVPGRHIYSCPFGRKTVRTIAVFRQKSPRNRAVSVKPKTIRAHVRSILRRGPLHRRRALRIGPTQPPSTLALQRPEKSLLSQDWHEPMFFQLRAGPLWPGAPQGPRLTDRGLPRRLGGPRAAGPTGPISILV